MKPLAFSWGKFNTIPVVGILRNLLPDQIHRILPLYIDAGFTTVEITIDSKDATHSISSALEKFGAHLNIGAGTVCTMADLEKALEAGAQFIVTPILSEEVIRHAVSRKIPVFPGAYTPTEIFRATALGADMVKVFPATSLGTSYIKEIKAPLKNIRLLPTGGINLSNCTEFLDAGATGLGIGSQLFDKDLIATENWKTLREHFGKYSEKIMQHRKRTVQLSYSKL